MEEHRLSPMPEGYNVELFNDLYKKTKQLRRKLAYEIGPGKFGVDVQEIESWFDIKFLFTFQKYHDKKEPEMLKGYLINSLRMYKMRILKVSYNQKMQLYNSQNLIDITKVYETIGEPEEDSRELFLNIAMEFMKNTLSDEAFFLLKLQLNPPHYITSRVRNPQRVPPIIWAKYLDMGTSSKAISFISSLSKEIQNATLEARLYFSKNTRLIDSLI